MRMLMMEYVPHWCHESLCMRVWLTRLGNGLEWYLGHRQARRGERHDRESKQGDTQQSPTKCERSWRNTFRVGVTSVHACVFDSPGAWEGVEWGGSNGLWCWCCCSITWCFLFEKKVFWRGSQTMFGVEMGRPAYMRRVLGVYYIRPSLTVTVVWHRTVRYGNCFCVEDITVVIFISTYRPLLRVD